MEVNRAPRDIRGMNEKRFFRSFGQKIRRLRKHKGWSQERLAEAIGRSPDTISNVERGVNATRLATVLHLARALGVSIPELFETEPVDALDRDRRAVWNRIATLIGDQDLEILRHVENIVAAALPMSQTKKK